MMDYCAECGNQLSLTDYGARIQCCNGLGYWSTAAPEHGYRLTRIDGYWLYIDLNKWPDGKKAVLPKNGTANI